MAGKILTTDRHGRTRSRSASGFDGGQYLDEERHGALAAQPALFDDFEEIGRPEPDLTTLPSRMPDLERAVEKANDRLRRAGLEDRFAFEQERRIEQTEAGTFEVVDIRLSRPKIAVPGGWRIEGVHERTGTGGFLSRWSEGAEVEPPEDASCDVCGAARAREKVYTVRGADGMVRHVGSSCLVPLMGVKPEGLWALDWRVEDHAPALGGDEIPEAVGWDSDYGVVEDRDVILAGIRAAAETGGYLSNSRASDLGRESTADYVRKRLDSLLDAPATPAEEREVEAIIKCAREIEGMDDYPRQMREVFAPGPDGRARIRSKHAGYAVSAIGVHERAEADRERERKKAEVESRKRKAYLAAPKESLKGRGVTAEITSMRRAPNGFYGGREAPDSYHITMLDPDGHVIYWRASNPPEGLRPGATVAIDSGTVKANRQSDFNGDYETVITRAKMRILDGDDEQVE